MTRRSLSRALIAAGALAALPGALAAHTGHELGGGIARTVAHWLSSPHHLVIGVGVAAVAILASAVWSVWPRRPRAHGRPRTL